MHRTRGLHTAAATIDKSQGAGTKDLCPQATTCPGIRGPWAILRPAHHPRGNTRTQRHSTQHTWRVLMSGPRSCSPWTPLSPLRQAGSWPPASASSTGGSRGLVTSWSQTRPARENVNVKELRLGFSNTARNPEGILSHNSRKSYMVGVGARDRGGGSR